MNMILIFLFQINGYIYSMSMVKKRLKSKKKPENALCKYSNKKNLTDMEKLQYENMKLKIENERLKKDT